MPNHGDAKKEKLNYTIASTSYGLITGALTGYSESHYFTTTRLAIKPHANLRVLTLGTALAAGGGGVLGFGVGHLNDNAKKYKDRQKVNYVAATTIALGLFVFSILGISLAQRVIKHPSIRKEFVHKRYKN